MRLFTQDDIITSEWAGGSTRQLCIYPLNATYAERDFQLRISIANVELEESTFTSLQGYNRKLMLLSGNIRIAHEGYHSRQLQAFDTDEFDGAWTTRSIGKCIDFNVMVTKSLSSMLSHLCLRAGQQDALEIDENESVFIYVWSGSIAVIGNGETAVLEKNELLKMDGLKKELCSISARSLSELVVVRIRPMLS